MPSRRYHPYQQFTKGFLADRHTEYRKPCVLNLDLDAPLGYPMLDMATVVPVLRQMELNISTSLRTMPLLSATLSGITRDVTASTRFMTQIAQVGAHCRNLYP